MEFIKKRRTEIMVTVMTGVSVFAFSFGIWAMWFQAPVVVEPDYAVREMDSNATEMERSENTMLDIASGDGAATLIFERQVDIDLSHNVANFLVENPARATNNLVVEIVVKNQVIARSGAIKPGYRLTELNLTAGVGELLEPGVSDGQILVYTYDSETGERAVDNSKIIVTIIVRK